jgi:hypothetical protein
MRHGRSSAGGRSLSRLVRVAGSCQERRDELVRQLGVAVVVEVEVIFGAKPPGQVCDHGFDGAGPNLALSYELSDPMKTVLARSGRITNECGGNTSSRAR